jgi:hypothetical protein
LKKYRNIIERQSEERRNDLKRIIRDYYNIGKGQLFMFEYKGLSSSLISYSGYIISENDYYSV